MRIERVQRASEHGLGSTAGPRRPFKFSTCTLSPLGPTHKSAGLGVGVSIGVDEDESQKV